MAKPPTRITQATIQAAMDTPAVRVALAAKARRVLPRAERLAIQANAFEFARTLRIEQGVRPGARAKGGLRRPFARVVGDATEEVRTADARASMTRQEIMRRAAGA